MGPLDRVSEARASRLARWSSVLALGALGALGAAVAASPAYGSSLRALSRVSLSSSAAGASGVAYTVGFKTSSKGGLAAYKGDVIVRAPAGTKLTASVGIYDSTRKADISNSGMFLTNGGATGRVNVRGATPGTTVIHGGDSLVLTITGVMNPSRAASGLTLGLSTSSDTAVVRTPAYATIVPRSVSRLTVVSLSSSSAGASGVTYTVGFTTSQPGGGLAAYGGDVIVRAPAGTKLSPSVGIYDSTRKADISNSGMFVTNGGATGRVNVRGAATGTTVVHAGDSLVLTIKGVTNPPRAAVYRLGMSTSSDTVVAASPAYVIGGLPAPQNGRSVDVAPVSGSVLVKVPGQAGFTNLMAGQRIPVGSVVDTTGGRVRLVSAANARGSMQSGVFYGGAFVVGQRRGKALTTLRLTGGNFATCPRRAGDVGSVAALAARHPRRHVWGSGKGSFGTSGTSASATVRGTTWLTEDDCEGTLIRVARGTVAVRDLVRKKTIIVTAPHSYFAHR